MPDPVTGAVLVGGGATVYAGRQAKKGAEAAAAAQQAASEAGIAEQRAARESFEERTQPFVDIGLGSQGQLLELLGLGESESRLLTEKSRLEDQLSGRRSIFSPIHEERLAEINQILEQRGQELPQLPTAVDLEQLPESPQAFGPESFQDNPMLNFLMEEGFRGIKERAAGGGRVPDRDLVRFAQGTAATLLPQLQAQQFGQQQALRSQALGEQAQQFGQLGGLRESAISEEQRKIANLQNLLGMGQATAVGQGQAALQTGANVSNLLGNIGTAQAQGALGKAQANQQLAGNLTGLLGMGLGYMQQPTQQAPLATTPPPPPQQSFYMT